MNAGPLAPGSASDAELLARLHEAEAASAYKSWFVGQVSHEFRTPLNSILGFTALLLEEGEEMPDAARSEYLRIVHRSAQHLLHVVNDILNLSKVEAGTLEVLLQGVEVVELTRTLVSSIGPLALERAIRVRLELPDEPVVARADAGRLRQVLLNLLENAIKYSPRESSIEIRVRSSGEGRVRIEVADEGPGIAPEDRERLFKEFSRIHQDGKKISGAGLGLALCRRFMELMKGDIGVDSRPGEGSTFWIELPRQQRQADPNGEASAAPFVSRRPACVAIVDDEPDILLLVSTVLRRAGYAVITDPGSPGVAERLAGKGISLVLLDLNLDGWSGVEALETLRSSVGMAGIPVVAFTASTAPEDLRRIERAGFDHHLMKPVEPGRLVAEVDRFLATGGSAEDDHLEPLRRRFVEGVPRRLAAIRHHVVREEREQAVNELHKLRGAAGGYGFSTLADAAAEAEELLRLGGDESRLRALLDRLAGEVEPVG